MRPPTNMPPPLFTSASRFHHITSGLRHFGLEKMPKKRKMLPTVSEVSADEALRFDFFDRMKDATVAVDADLIDNDGEKHIQGSGVVFHTAGQNAYILTCAHVLGFRRGCHLRSVKIQLFGRKKYKAKPFIVDVGHDLAILKICDRNRELKLFPAKFAKKENIKVGLDAHLIYNSCRNYFSLTKGSISCGRRLYRKSAIGLLGIDELEELKEIGITLDKDTILIQHDASANGRASGCPIFTSYGQMMGIHIVRFNEINYGIHVETAVKFLNCARQKLNCCEISEMHASEIN